MNIVSFHRKFFNALYNTGCRPWYGNRPFTRRKITVSIMKQSGLPTNNSLWKKLSYELFFCNTFTLWELIKSSANSFNNSFLQNAATSYLFIPLAAKSEVFAMPPLFSITFFKISFLLKQAPTFFTQVINNVCNYYTIWFRKSQQLYAYII